MLLLRSGEASRNLLLILQLFYMKTDSFQVPLFHPPRPPPSHQTERMAAGIRLLLYGAKMGSYHDNL